MDHANCYSVLVVDGMNRPWDLIKPSKLRKHHAQCAEAGKTPVILFRVEPERVDSDPRITWGPDGSPHRIHWPMLPLTRVDDATGQQLLLAYMGYYQASEAKRLLKAIQKHASEMPWLVIVDTGHLDLLLINDPCATMLPALDWWYTTSLLSREAAAAAMLDMPEIRYWPHMATPLPVAQASQIAR